jgi:hypothetical protein
MDTEQRVTFAFGLDTETDLLGQWVVRQWTTFLLRQRIRVAGLRLLVTVFRH